MTDKLICPCCGRMLRRDFPWKWYSCTNLKCPYLNITATREQWQLILNRETVLQKKLDKAMEFLNGIKPSPKAIGVQVGAEHIRATIKEIEDIRE